jgi:hypothetical protein
MIRLLFNRVSFEVTRQAAFAASRISMPSSLHRSAADAASGRMSLGAARNPLMQTRVRQLAPWDHTVEAEKPDLLSKLQTIARLPLLEVEVSPQQAQAWRALTFPAAGDSIFDGYLAQAILNLDLDDSDYLSGRRRQALRTNLRHARSKGIRAVRLQSFEDWYPVRREMLSQRGMGYNLVKTSAPGSSQDMGYFAALDVRGRVVAELAVAIFEKAAVLFSSLSRREHHASAESRYLLHTFMRSELRSQGVRNIIAGSVLRVSPGSRYFQHLVGYDVLNVAVTVRKTASGAVRQRKLGVATMPDVSIRRSSVDTTSTAIAATVFQIGHHERDLEDEYNCVNSMAPRTGVET